MLICEMRYDNRTQLRFTIYDNYNKFKRKKVCNSKIHRSFVFVTSVTPKVVFDGVVSVRPAGLDRDMLVD